MRACANTDASWPKAKLVSCYASYAFKKIPTTRKSRRPARRSHEPSALSQAARRRPALGLQASSSWPLGAAALSRASGNRVGRRARRAPPR